MKKFKRKLGKMNIPLEQWSIDETKRVDGFLVIFQIGNIRMGVRNRECMEFKHCNHGWNARFGRAIYNNTAYHKTCLINKFGRNKFNRLVKDGYIISD